MKLASLKEGRDGQLIIVSRDLTRYTDATASLQVALEHWDEAEPELRAIADALEAGKVDSSPFDPADCAAPLPRSFGWADGSAYVNHVELVRKARNAEMPSSFWTDALMYRGGSDQSRRLGSLSRTPRAVEVRGRRLGHRLRSRSRGHRRRRADGHFRRRSAEEDFARHARQ